MNKTLVKYVLTAARRDRLFLSLLAVMVTGGLLSLFLSSSAIIEQGGFFLIYLASSLRLLGLAALVLFVVFFVRRSFESRDVEYLLTRPVSRSSFILSHAAGFSLLSLIVSGGLGLALVLLAYQTGNFSGALYWSTGIICEYLLMVNVAFFFAMVLSSPVASALSAMGFYILGRLMGQLLFIAKTSPMEIAGHQSVSWLFQAISTLVPRLDLMTQSSWIIYGAAGIHEYVFILIQAFLFLFLILIATLTDLKRRQF